MTQAEHNALVAESHKFGMQVMTHVTGFNAHQMAIQSKLDVIQHMPADFPVNDDGARRKDSGTVKDFDISEGNPLRRRAGVVPYLYSWGWRGGHGR